MALTKEEERRKEAFTMALQAFAASTERPTTVAQVLSEADTFYQYLTKK